MGRLNTFRINYGNLPNKPGLGKLQKFCATELGLKKGEVVRFQNSRALGVTFVTVVDFELAYDVVEKHGNTHHMTGNDEKEYPITLTLEDGAVEVKLFDLSVDVTDEDIFNFLREYGTVRSIYEEQLGEDQDFPGAYTGIRIAKMVVDQNIDSWINIKGELTQVTYFGQRQTCRHCREFLHIGATCVQNKKLLVQKSYADAAKQPAKPETSGKTNKQNHAGRQQKNKQPLGRAKPQRPSKPRAASPNRQANSNEDNETSKATDEISASPENSLFIPPANPSGSTSGSGSLNSQGQPTHAGRKTAGAKFDGNETDTSVASSTTSKRSLRGRPPGKKQKGDDNEREEEVEL